MANEPKNKAFKKIKDVARVALGQPAVSQDTEPVITGDTPNYREDPHGTAENRANVPKEFLKLFESDASEIILEQGLRHPFMIYAIYVVTAFVVILITTLMGAVLVNPKDLIGTNISANAASIIALIAMFAAVFSILVGVLSAYLYGKSRLILTNQKIVLIHYHSLFSREVSQLNIADVEDVNVLQPTIIDRLAKSGTITIETAGEQTNYTLTWINKPFDFAKHAIQAHEGSIAEYGN